DETTKQERLKSCLSESTIARLVKNLPELLKLDEKALRAALQKDYGLAESATLDPKHLVLLVSELYKKLNPKGVEASQSDQMHALLNLRELVKTHLDENGWRGYEPELAARIETKEREQGPVVGVVAEAIKKAEASVLESPEEKLRQEKEKKAR